MKFYINRISFSVKPKLTRTKSSISIFQGEERDRKRELLMWTSTENENAFAAAP